MTYVLLRVYRKYTLRNVIENIGDIITTSSHPVPHKTSWAFKTGSLSKVASRFMSNHEVVRPKRSITVCHNKEFKSGMPISLKIFVLSE